MALLTTKRAIFDAYDSVPEHVDRRELLFQRSSHVASRV